MASKVPHVVAQGAAQRPEPAPATARPRLYFIDNLRWTMILLVISMHAADTYSPLGNWYFVDRRPLSGGELLFFAAWQMYLQSFFMGLLFFIAGYFVPGSFDRKGPARFVRERTFRLGLPVLFYMFVLGPVTEYFCAHSWNSTEPTSFAKEWIKHIRNGQFWQENGPLWFCLALLIFSSVYAGIGAARPHGGKSTTSRAPSTGWLVLFALAMAGFAFLVRLILPPGFSFLNMHLSDFPQYILLFSAGVAAGRGQWLFQLSHRAGVLWLFIVLPTGFAGWLALLRLGGAFSGNGRAFASGWHWQNAGFALWESVTCVAISYGLLVIYREKFNRQSRAARFLSDNAFSVYVFHPPFVILTARLMHGLAFAPLAKFSLLTCIAAVASFALSAAVFRRIPLLARIL